MINRSNENIIYEYSLHCDIWGQKVEQIKYKLEMVGSGEDMIWNDGYDMNLYFLWLSPT